MSFFETNRFKQKLFMKKIQDRAVLFQNSTNRSFTAILIDGAYQIVTRR